MNYKQEAQNLVNKMSVAEKISQMTHKSKGISRLGIDTYNWWNECLHGVGRAGLATVFPQSIGLAAMFDETFMFKVACVISDEVRAKYNETKLKYSKLSKLNPLYVHQLAYKGLTCWSPNINIFRDPRWGRGHETYGEDPYLTSRLGVAFVKGIQGNDSMYLKAIATPKHFAVHSGPEEGRHSFNSVVSKKDMTETYLPAFKTCIQEGNAASVMSAYNAVNGVPASMNSYILEEILRKDFKFDGYVVSDCGAIKDIYKHHKAVSTPEEATAEAVKAGCDLNCGTMYKNLKKAYKKNLISINEIEKSVTRLMEARLKLGMFSHQVDNQYDDISPEVICSETHTHLALEASKKSLVLLKNNGILPLSKNKRILVVGPNADSVEVLLGNYNGTPKSYTTILSGIKKLNTNTVLYEKGSTWLQTRDSNLNKILSLSSEVDVIINCIGLSPRIEGEEGDRFNSHMPAGDKLDLQLSKAQKQLFDTLKQTRKRIISVVISGSALDLRDIDKNSDAVIQAFYPGQDGGQAVAELIYGEFSPSGRLPISYVADENELPHFHNYSMENRTYRFMNSEAFYPFGYGLSYTKFLYSKPKLVEDEKIYELKTEIKNIGDFDGDEIIQVYVSSTNNPLWPNYKLVGFNAVTLSKGEKKSITIKVDKEQLLSVDESGMFCSIQGDYTFHIGGSLPCRRSLSLTNSIVHSISFSIK